MIQIWFFYSLYKHDQRTFMYTYKTRQRWPLLRSKEHSQLEWNLNFVWLQMLCAKVILHIQTKMFGFRVSLHQCFVDLNGISFDRFGESFKSIPLKLTIISIPCFVLSSVLLNSFSNIKILDLILKNNRNCRFLFHFL